MEKPPSMAVKEWLIKKAALKLNLPEKVVSAVVSDSYDRANSATLLHKSIELSGFGKFYFNEKRAIKFLALLEDKKLKYETSLNEDDLTEAERRQKGIYLHALIVDIKKLKAKL